MFDKKIYGTIPYFLLILVAFANIFLLFIWNSVDLAIRSIVITLPALLSAIFLIKIFRGTSSKRKIIEIFENSKEKYIFDMDYRILLLLFLYLYLISVFILYTFTPRPIIYFLIITSLYTIIFLQIFNKSLNSKLIIFQNVLLFINILFGMTIKYPLYFGGTDPIAHLNMAQGVTVTGGISHLGLNYANFPLYHIFLGQSSLISGLDIISTKSLFTGIVFSFGIILVYGITKKIFNNERLGLLGMLLFSSLTVVISNGMYMVTRTMAFLGFLFLIYYSMKFHSERQLSYYLIFTLVTLFIILVHQVSVYQFLVLLLILYGIGYLYNNQIFTSNDLILFISITVTYWVFIAYRFTSHVLINILLKPGRTTELALPDIALYDITNYLIMHIRTSIFILLFLIGISLILYYTNNTKIKVIALFSFIISIFYIPSPIDAIDIGRSLNVGRYSLFVSPFMGIGLAIGFYLLVNWISNLENFNSFIPSKTQLASIILVTIFVFSSITTPGLVTDTNIWDHNPTRYFGESDLATFEFVDERVEENSTILSDHFVFRFFRLGGHNITNTEMTRAKQFNRARISNVSALSNLTEGTYVIYRQAEFYEKNTLRFMERGNVYSYIRTEDNQSILEKNLNKNNKIHTNGDNHIYN